MAVRVVLFSEQVYKDVNKEDSAVNYIFEVVVVILREGCHPHVVKWGGEADEDDDYFPDLEGYVWGLDYKNVKNTGIFIALWINLNHDTLFLWELRWGLMGTLASADVYWNWIAFFYFVYGLQSLIHGFRENSNVFSILPWQ